jgi:hypothetical protein
VEGEGDSSQAPCRGGLAWRSGHILLVLGPLLVTMVHPEVRRVEDKLDNNDGLDRTYIEEVD